MNIDFLSPTDPRWQGLLQRAPHQFYHLPAFCQLWAEHDRGRSEAVLVSENDDFLFLPYTVLPHGGPDGVHGSDASYSDIRSPYGYPGPLANADASPTFLRSALQLWTGAMRSRRVVSGFVRLDPLASTISPMLAHFGELHYRGETISVDLTANDDLLWQQIRRQMRQRIESAKLAGLKLRMLRGEPPCKTFHSIYNDTLQRVGAAENYYFSRDHFERLANALGDGLCVCLAETSCGEVLAGGVFIEHEGIVQHHLQASGLPGFAHAANKLIVHAMIGESKQRGNRVLHLGGGRGGETDPLLQFKAGFSKRRHAYATWHIAFLPTEHRRLNDLCDLNVQQPSAARFFPSYRFRGVG